MQSPSNKSLLSTIKASKEYYKNFKTQKGHVLSNVAILNTCASQVGGSTSPDLRHFLCLCLNFLTHNCNNITMRVHLLYLKVIWLLSDWRIEQQLAFNKQDNTVYWQISDN